MATEYEDDEIRELLDAAEDPATAPHLRHLSRQLAEARNVVEFSPAEGRQLLDGVRDAWNQAPEVRRARQRVGGRRLNDPTGRW